MFMVKNKKSMLIQIVILSLFLVLNASCIGGNATIRFDSLSYPVSLSNSLYNEKGRPVSIGHGLTFVKSWKFEKDFWGILYSELSLTSYDDLIDSMNNNIKNNNGRGMINVTFTSQGCELNDYISIGLLPILPGCTHVKAEGIIVK